jgi:hypothetical protein
MMCSIPWNWCGISINHVYYSEYVHAVVYCSVALRGEKLCSCNAFDMFNVS